MGMIMYIVPVVLVCVVIVVTVPLTVVIRDTALDTEEGPLVVTNIGTIRGIAVADGNYYKFLGIPYATVNYSHPFGSSIPHEGFEGIFNAFDDSSICPQIKENPWGQGGQADGITPIGTLDCLHLSIHVPRSASPANRVPVMVWIHGGGFDVGFTGRLLYDPTFLVRQDVIVVSLNYRLGPYGWLCLNIPEVPGNQGLKDQLTALRWIKDNIEAFGGDTDRITIFGESVGGASVDLHYKFSHENLFNNLILQSGTSLTPFPYLPNPFAVLQLALYLGQPTTNVYDALNFLNTVPSDRIVEASVGSGLIYSPCVELESDDVDRYITAHPTQVNVPYSRAKPILVGFTNNEFGIDLDPQEYEGLFGLVKLLLYYFDPKPLPDAMEIVRKFYIGDEDYDAAEQEERLRRKMPADFGVFHPTYRLIRKYLENEASSIYHYMFSYVGGRNFLQRRLNITHDGALHSDELSYLFDQEFIPEPPMPEDQLMIDRMTTMWANFAKYSNPTPEITDILPVLWPAVTNESMHCLNIDSEVRLQRRVYHDRMAFWDLFFMMFETIS